MTARYVKLEELRRRLGVDQHFVRTVVDEGLVEIKRSTVDEEPLVSAEDAERLRLIAVLVRELDVNLPGVEVILHMREDLCAMQHQFDEILRALVEELRRRIVS